MPNRHLSDQPVASLPRAASAQVRRQPAGELRTLVDLIGRWRQNEEPAVIVDQEGEPEVTTYSWLADTAAKIAARLRSAGLEPEERIAILAPNSPAWIAAYFGIIASGATAVPLDYHSAASELEGMLTRSKCRRLFTSKAALENLPKSWSDGADAVHVLDDPDRAEGKITSWTVLFEDARDVALPAVRPDHLASLLFTSGTTGTPKAVPLTHSQFLSNVNALMQANLIRAGDRVLLPLPLHHTYPFTVGMLTSLSIGATLVLPGGATGPQILQAARTAAVSAILGVPGLYAAMINGIEARMKRRGWLARSAFRNLLSLSTWLSRRLGLRVGRALFAPLHREFGGKLRVLSSGGAKLDPEIAWTLEGLGWRVLTGYGLTETAPILTFNAPHNARIGSEGRPIPGVQLRTVPVEGSEFGEIIASGPSVFSGYLDNPEANAEAFVEPGWFRTKDLGFVDEDGYLHIVGRVNETLVLPGGKKLFPEDIEGHYADILFIKEMAILQHKNALVALVVPNPEAIRTRGATRLDAMLREEIEHATATLRPHERITGYAVTREALPRTQLGKLKRHLLPTIYEQAKAGKRQKPQVELAAEDRELLARPDTKPIWDWLVARYPDQTLTPDTSPQLDLGVDSLQWIELTLELQEHFGVRFNEAAISRILSIRDLLNEAAQLRGAPTAPTEPAPDAAQWVRPIGLGHKLLGLILYGIDKGMARLMFRLQVIGRDKLPGEDRIVLTPNHVSFLDPILLAAALNLRELQRTCWVGWSGIMLAGPIMRLVSRTASVLPIDPDRDPAAALDLVDTALRTKTRLVWFPEGRRSPTGELSEFLPGIALVLERTGAKAVPVHISGTYEAWPRSRTLPRPHKVTIRFGLPISADELAERGEGANRHARIANALQKEVAALGHVNV
ncbi:AMP-binding protein [Dongia deserti]|uniref:AMP-binding protein n=1 Tax=Dongia deserti TaxID=2268030 RepID=UPI000E656A83|nr:AMP-binding protein [Dongia deserti]